MSRCSGFPEAFVHAALFCCPAHTVFGSPSPGHGKEDRCIVLPTGTNKAPGIHERQWPGREFCSVCWVYHKLYLRGLWDGRYAARIAVYGGFARVVGRRHCSFGRRTAVRIAVCKQISERCFRTVNPPHLSFAKCEIFKWVSVLAYPCYMDIMGGFFCS